MLLMQLDFYANAFLCHEQSIHTTRPEAVASHSFG